MDGQPLHQTDGGQGKEGHGEGGGDRGRGEKKTEGREERGQGREWGKFETRYMRI